MSILKLIAIVGPTATGKTAWAEDFARKYNGYIISADSRQIYRGMDIGTNKEQKLSCDQYMTDIVNPDKQYTLAEYQQDVYKLIKKETKRLPFLVGGTGLYVQAVIDNLEIPKAPPNFSYRNKLEQEIKEKGLDNVSRRLEEIDPGIKSKIDIKNPRRVIRALEVFEQTGKPFSEQSKPGPKKFTTLQVGIDIPRDKLYSRINTRVDQMMNEGLLNEVRDLVKQGYSTSLPSMSGIGYRELVEHLEGKMSLEDAIDQIKQHTRNYARRQMTWFRRDKRIKWVTKRDEAETLIKKFLK